MKKPISLYSAACVLIVAAAALIHALAGSTPLSVVADLPSSSSSLLKLSALSAEPEPGEQLSGGATTVRDTGIHAFGRVPMNLVGFDTNWIYFREGRKVFERSWFAIKANHLMLGPYFNGVSCATCHKFDGRGRPPLGPDEEPESIIMRLGIPDGNGSRPDPVYGDQLNYFAIDSVVPEGKVKIRYEEIQGHFADGSSYSLRLPSYEIGSLGYGPLASGVQVSPRVAPANFGLGLLEAIPEASILALADPDDRNGDGISGRPNYVHDIHTGKEALGRFGWKANQPTIAQQILRAFISDIGITSHAYPDDNLYLKTAASRPNPYIELGDTLFNSLLYYMKLLAVPARRHWEDPKVRRGKMIFREIGCGGCHRESFVTGVMEGYHELSNQKIYPYTDMLLHDMGEGLADGHQDGRANGREWRTPPLWGIGLVKAVSDHTFFLHDGRARNLEEAVLWHGGEAEAAQNRYRRLPKEDRSALLAFLESL